MDKAISRFCWFDLNEQDYSKQTEAEKYRIIVNWAAKARGQNPEAFDSLTEWILEDSAWSKDRLRENEKILMQGVLARFQKQNARLRSYLKKLEPSGVVNKAVFKALGRFDEELSGHLPYKPLQDTVAEVFADFAVMQKRSMREPFAGNKTGPSGTDSVPFFGYINSLKDCDAGVQWALFMPDLVERQQQGFHVDRFEYKTMSAMRFIGFEGEEYDDLEKRMKTMKKLDSMAAYKSGLDYDVLFMHHYGMDVDVGAWHGVWGRFMKADTPVPDGFIGFDFVPERRGEAGPPYISQFALAVFAGDLDAMHQMEGYDGGAMYDVTRNIILSQCVNIPYPDKYWTAEVYLNGCDKPSTAYMFSAEL